MSSTCSPRTICSRCISRSAPGWWACRTSRWSASTPRSTPPARSRCRDSAVFNKYYQDELLFLREMGREFSRANPDAAPFLAEAGSDPDVERLLENFAFLTGRLRQKLDDELPELTHALLETFFPHYLRPTPSLAIVQFEPLPQAAKALHHSA